MKYKKRDYIKYYDSFDEIRSGVITRVNENYYSVKQGYSTEKVEEKDVIEKTTNWDFFWGSIGTLFAIILIVGACIYIYLGITKSNHTEPPRDKYAECLRSLTYVYDNLNDTVGSSVFHEDTPSQELKALIDQCMELKI